MISNANVNEAKGVLPTKAGATFDDAPDRTLTSLDSDDKRLGDEIIAALKTIYDPEIPADLYELGLIYRIAVDADRSVTIDLTLTSPNCPAAAVLPGQVQRAVADVASVREAKVNIVWDPPWNPSRMSEEARWVLDMW